MGQCVPYMPRPARRELIEVTTLEDREPRFVMGRVLSQGRTMLLNCTQCGAPHEAHASVCAYCLSPKAIEAQAPQHFFTIGDVSALSQVIDACNRPVQWSGRRWSRV